MRALVVVNPQSRRGIELGDVAVRALAARGIDVVDPRSWPEPQVDCIVAVGGDGTICGTIPLALRANVPIGVVPAGTFNELARTLGIPLAVAAACDTIAAGRTRTIDVARVNGVYYLSEASIGISSRLARLQTPQEKKRFGWLAIIGTALLAFRHSRPIHVSLGFDGEHRRLNTVQLTIANSHRFGGFFNVGDAAIDDGWLDLYSIEIDNVFQAFSVARAMLQGKRQSAPGLRTYRSTSFTLHTRRHHRITADGEPAGKTPATFEVLPKALRVFVPE